ANAASTGRVTRALQRLRGTETVAQGVAEVRVQVRRTGFTGLHNRIVKVHVRKVTDRTEQARTIAGWVRLLHGRLHAKRRETASWRRYGAGVDVRSHTGHVRHTRCLWRRLWLVRVLLVGPGIRVVLTTVS